MKRLLFLFLFLYTVGVIYAQVDVTATGGDPSESYTTLKAAFDSINTGFHTGTITIGISGNTTETATAVLNASGTGSASYTSIIISPSGGAARTISGSMAAALIELNGADYVTIDGLNTGGNSLTISNTSTASTSGTSTIRLYNDATNNVITKCSILGSATMSLATNGGNIFISTAASGGTGNDDNTISYCLIGPAGSNLPSKGIYGNGTTTSSAIANSNITITNCEIYDYFLTGGCGGIYATTGNTDWTITYNKIYQTATRTFTSTGTMYGIYFSNSTYGNNIQITNNTVGYSSNSGTGTLTLLGAVAGAFQGIYMNAMTTAANACNINDNVVSDISLTSTSGALYAIYNATGASSNTININNNSIKNISLITSTGSLYGIAWTSATNMTITGNTVHDFYRTGAGTIYGIYSASSSVNETVSNNTVYNLTAASSTTTSTIYGIYQLTAAGTKVFQNNTIYNLRGYFGNTIYGLSLSYGTTVDISNNTIYSLQASNGTGGTIYGLRLGSTTSSMSMSAYKNKIYDLSSGSTGAAVYGINIEGSGSTTTRNIYNNLVGNLKADSVSGIDAVRGINITSTGTSSNINVYYNTVYINATSVGANFGSTGIYHTTNATATTAALDLRNNIIVNNSTANGTGLTVAYRRSSTTLTNYSSLSNNNDFYAPNLFYDGTTAYTTLPTYQTLVSPRDASSISENPTFVSTSGSSANFLHINTGVGTQIESGGSTISSPIAITTDFDGDTRLSPPDIGADEFAGIGIDLNPPIVSYTPLSNTVSTSSRTLVATITDYSGVPTSDPGMPRLYWKKNFDGTYNSVTPSYLGSNQYQFTGIGSGVANGDTVYYYFVARDFAGTPNIASTPGGASGFTYDPPAASTPPASPNYYNIISVISSFPYTENFDSKILTWSTGILTGSVNDWVKGTPSKTQISAPHSSPNSYVTQLTGTTTSHNHNAYVLSPHFDFGSLSNPTLSFWHNFLTETNYDACVVEYTTDFGSTWAKLDPNLGTGGNFNTTLSTNWYNNNSSSGSQVTPPKFSNTSTGYTGHSSGWIKSNTDLIALAGQIVQFRFRYGTDGSKSALEGWAIDDIEIKNLDVANPATFTATPFSSTQIDLTFTTNANTDTVVIVWNSTGLFTDPTGAPPAPGGSLAGGTVVYKGLTSPQSHSSLTPATTYFYKAFSYNGSLYSSGFSANATTLCGVLTGFTQNFDAVTVPALPTCWVKVGAGGSAYTQTTNPSSSPNCLYIYASSTTSLPVVRMPELSNAGAGTHILKLKARANFTVGGVIQIGYLTNPNDSSTFVKVDSIVANALTYNDYSVNLGTAPGSYTYLAFRHTGSPANSVLIDDVVWEALVAMSVDSTTTTQNTADVGINQTNQQIIGVRVYTTGTLTPLSVSNFNFNTNGTTNTADISNAKVFYTGTSGTFSAVNQFGSTVASPSGAFSISGTQTLATGANYFWLTYDIPSGATPDNLADAECNQITIGSNYVPTVQAPAGARTIRGPMSGSYNVGLTPFNKVTGKNLTVQKLTRKTEQWIYELNNNENVQKTKQNSGFEESPFAPEKPGKMELVDEEYFVLMENGQLYSGELSFKVKEEVSTENGSQFIETESFATLTAAISALNIRGVNGAVTFVLKDASYSASENFPLNIDSVKGGSSTNTVTIKPYTGVTATISGAVASSKIFNINSSNIIIDGSNSGGTSRDLTITNTSTTSPTTINIGSPGTSAITNITVKNCIVINGANTSSAIVVGDGDTTGNAGYFNEVTIQNNSIQKAYIGIYNKAVLQTGNGSGLKILNNTLTTSGANAIRYIGTYLQDITGAEVSGNSFANFDGSSSEDDKGINLYNTNNTIIEKNNIYSLKYTGTLGYGCWGISNYFPSATVSTNVIKNNMISDITGDGYSYTSILGDNPMGIYLYGSQSGAKVYHNSIYLSGNTLNAANALSIGIAIGTGASADVRNNIIINNLGLSGALGYGSAGIFLQSSASQLEQGNFNNFVVSPTGAGVKNIGQIATTGYTTLSAWQTATGKEQYSTNNTVTFTGATDLHLSGGSVGDGNLASASVGVTTDFDGDARNSYWPYMGADEVTASPLSLKLTLTALIEGFYANGGLQDTLQVHLAKPTSPYTKYAPAKGLSSTGGVDFYLPKTNNESSYYVAVTHRNAVETWSASPINTSSFPAAYDFTTAQSQAYGSNMVQVSGKWCFFSGDVNQDGNVDLTDLIEVDNDNANFVTGYVPSDVDGSLSSDLSDMIIVDNNNAAFVGKVIPTVLMSKQRLNYLIELKKNKSVE